MTKKKRTILGLVACSLTVLQAVVANINTWFWLKTTLSGCLFVATIVVLIVMDRLVAKAYKVEVPLTEPIALKPTDPTLLDMYAILKIAPQYNTDGSLKDMYQLLGIAPMYDEKGNRILTIYERLGINPTFNASGKEVPTVLRIKNRVNSLVKLQAPTTPLVYVPRDLQIVGQKPVIPPPSTVVTPDKVEKQPTIKDVPVVKTKAPAPKKQGAKKPSVNYGASQRATKVGDYEVEYKAVKRVDGTGGFNPFSIKDKTKKEAPKIEIQKEPPMIVPVIINKPEKQQIITVTISEPRYQKKDEHTEDLSKLKTVKGDGQNITTLTSFNSAVLPDSTLNAKKEEHQNNISTLGM